MLGMTKVTADNQSCNDKPKAYKQQNDKQQNEPCVTGYAVN